MAAHRKLGGRKVSLPTNFHETSPLDKHTKEKLQQYHSFIETKKSIKQQYHKLVRERDDLRDEVVKLANYNYAREPEFVRDRSKLREKIDEVGHLKRHVERKFASIMEKVLGRLEKEQTKLNELAGLKFEESEKFAKSYIEGEMKTTHDNFIENYTKLRKEAHKVSIVSERLNKERETLARDIVNGVSKMPRQITKDINNNDQPAEENDSSDPPIPAPRQRKRVCFNK